MNESDYTQKLENASRACVRDGGATYREFHDEFGRKSLCCKLWLIARALPTHVWYSWLAPAKDKYTYRALRAYLSRQIKND